jgi:hypothetical protein
MFCGDFPHYSDHIVHFYNHDHRHCDLASCFAVCCDQTFCGRFVLIALDSNATRLQVTSQQFTYYQHPSVLNLEPSGGPITGGTGVTVIGSGFTVFSDPLRTPKCKFGSLVVQARADSDDKMFCVTPETLTAGYVSVTVSLNEVDFTSPALGRQYSIPFLYYEQPEIKSLMPNTGPSRGGTRVHIVGKGFLQLPSQPACRFVGINDPTIIMDVQGKFLNDTLMECVTPAIADLCTPKHFCRDAVSADPNWRGCVAWKTCPFNNQCKDGLNSACGCPQGPRCKSYEEDGATRVQRDQIGEDVSYDVSIQLSLNGICCKRDNNGRLTDGCLPCMSVSFSPLPSHHRQVSSRSEQAFWASSIILLSCFILIYPAWQGFCRFLVLTRALKLLSP